MRIALVGALLLSIFPAFALLQSDDFKISTDVFNVLLDVGVRDSKGGYVSRLTKDDFRVEEDGVPQKISSFSNEDVPVTAGLIMDDSGSMRPKRLALEEAGRVFVAASNPQDEMFVINFNDEVRFGLPESMPFSDNPTLLAAALTKDPPAGRTKLYDAIAAGLRHLGKGTRDRKTLLIVSDGGDDASHYTLKDVMQMIEESHATVYTIALFDDEDPYRHPKILQRMALVSGGEFFLLEHDTEMVATCLNIARDLRHRYTIGYIPTSNGGRHTIKVTASAPHHGHLIVQTRTSYVSPPRS